MMINHLFVLASLIAVYLALYATKDEIKELFKSFWNKQNNS